jgi:hypothetical protein
MVPLDASGAQQVEVPGSQMSPLTQSLAEVQVSRQALVPQMKGVQAVVPGELLQLPNPSQALGFCWRPALQLSAMVPQSTEASGKLQAPKLGSQSVAPHGGVVSVQACWQQLPTPAMLQIPVRQASSEPQGPVEILFRHIPASVPASSLQ